MKIIVSILLLFTASTLFSQKKPNNPDSPDTSAVIVSWKMTNNYTSEEQVPVDSNLTNFQQYNPIYQYSISNSYLGNLGSPVTQNVFTDKITGNDAFFLDNYIPYFFTTKKLHFYNTKKPFTVLTYTNSNLKNKDKNQEQSFNVFHTQNINPKLNFGLRYYLISSLGQYRYLNVKKNSFQLFSGYTGDRYKLYAGLNINRYRGYESGGLVDTVFSDTTFRFIKTFPTVFSGNETKYTSYTENRIRYYNLLVSQQLKLFTLATKEDTTNREKKRTIAEPVLTHILKISRATKTYSYQPPKSISPLHYYDNIYFNLHNTYDSIANYIVDNILQLDFRTTFRGKVQLGMFGNIGYQYETCSLYSKWDTDYYAFKDTTFKDTSYYKLFHPLTYANGDTVRGINQKRTLSDLFVTAGLYGNFWNKVKARFSWNLWFLGSRAGQTSLDGQLDTRITLLHKEFNFGAVGKIENKVPSFFLNTYYSNNYYWNQSLSPENDVILSSFIASPSNKFELRGNYRLLRNYIYFNNEVKPVNYNQILNYFSLEADKTFKIWEFYSQNKLIYQVSENKNVIPLPDLVYYTSTYVDHTFRFKMTGGKLQAMLGLDLYYNTKFNGYSYSPSLAQFYLQEEELIGNYPVIDAFLNLKLKSVRFYVKLQHFNIDMTNRKHYSVIDYPYNQYAFGFGLSWTFYN